jgi:predicted NUDIX family NTP pyrophosphohydrolase
MRKDEGAWSIPKGEYADGEDALPAAKREFYEETGFSVDGVFVPLGELKQPGGKVVTAWGLENDLDASLVRSNAFSLEWPPRSGRMRQFPEVDRAGWFTVALARRKILKGQTGFIDRLVSEIGDL